MKKTNNFFLIHNFNTVPEDLLAYCKEYLIVDASTDENTVAELKEKGLHFIHVENTGHNITTYFSYFAKHYEELPEVICICKGNMIGRHCSKEYFDRVYDNSYFTYLYEDRASRTKFEKADRNSDRRRADGADTGSADGNGQGAVQLSSISSLVSECQYIEENTSWYVDSPVIRTGILMILTIYWNLYIKTRSFRGTVCFHREHVILCAESRFVSIHRSFIRI